MISNIADYDDDVFLVKNPKLKTKDAIAGYEILLICILIGSFVTTIILKDCFRMKISNHFL